MRLYTRDELKKLLRGMVKERGDFTKLQKKLGVKKSRLSMILNMKGLNVSSEVAEKMGFIERFIKKDDLDTK